MKNQVTIKTIASQLKISVSTVSRALKNNPRIGHKTREQVKSLALKLNYSPNIASSMLKAEKTMNIGVIVPTLLEEFFIEIINVFEDYAEKLGYRLHIFQSRDDQKKQVEILDYIKRMRMDGVLISLAANTDKYEAFAQLESFGIPIVFFDRVPRGFPCFSVKNNIEYGMIEALKFLKNKGIEKVAFINGPGNLESSGDRLNSYLKGLKTLDMFSSPNLIKSSDLTFESVSECVKKLLNLESRPDAIIGFNDYVSLYAMKICKDFDLLPNRDMIFVGFGNLPFTAFVNNAPLASIEQFPQKMGLETIKLLFDRIDGIEDMSKNEKVIETQLIIH
jgi:DNA-binding LacI/PurR family transcriptional regulator